MKYPPPPRFKFWYFSLVACVAALIFAVAFVWPKGVSVTQTTSTVADVGGFPALQGDGGAAAVKSEHTEIGQELRGWVERYAVVTEQERQTELAAGITLAKVRREKMRELIRTEPQRALDEAFRWDEIDRLPSEVRGLVEKPFSEVVSYTSLPVCPGAGTSPGLRRSGVLEFADGTKVDAFAIGSRAQIGSKRDLLAQGISLDGVGAVRDGVFQPLTSEEVASLAGRFSQAQSDPRRSFVTGKVINGEPVHALAGGKMFSFASSEELRQLDRALVKLDLLPAPKSVTSRIFALPYSTGAAPSAGFDLPAAQMAAAAASAEWTLTKKKFFLIRVDFSDQPGEPVSKAAAESVLNNDVTNAISKMSYGNTSITATVSANVYRLPKTAAYYAGTSAAGYDSGTFSSENDELLSAARTAFRSSKSGQDASINIGSGDSGASTPIGDYDVVGVSFAEIGARSSGLKFAGLASVVGGDFWIQGNNSASVYVHEFGHIYGLGHSNFWQTTDSSVVGTGTEKEYGDIYDVMGDGKIPEGHFHPQAKQLLSWLDSSQWVDASAQGVPSKTYRVYRHDDASTSGAIRGVRITKSAVGATNPEYYWIGYRAAYPENAHLLAGAYLLWQRPGQVKSCLLDTTPLTSGDKTDAGLDIGRTYSDTKAGVHITPIARGGTGSDQYLDVVVNIGSFSGNRAPSLTAIGASSTFAARTAVTFTASASDADNDTLSYSWNAGDGTLSGGTGALAATLIHSYAMGGTYTVSVTVSDMKGGTTTQTKTVTVTDPAQSFTQRSSGTGADLFGVAASDTLLVAVGENGTGGDSHIIRTSPDGITWTGREVAESILNLKLSAVTWDGLRFVAVGQDWNGSGWVGVVYTSENGVVWTRVYTATSTGTSLVAVASGGGVILAGGDGGTLLRSPDGVNWTAVALVPSTSSVGGIAYGGGVFSLTTHLHDFGNGGGALYTSADGVSWTDRSAGMGIESGQDLRFIAFLNDRFVASGWFSKIRTSTDNAQSFTTTRIVSEEAAAAMYRSGLYFISGLERFPDKTTRQVDLYSIDGVTWQQKVLSGSVKTRNAGVVFNDRIVTVGDSGQILQSERLDTSVLNSAPVITKVNVPTTISARSSSVFSVTASDPDGDKLQYRWEGGNGIATSSAAVFVPRWDVGGSYQVSVTVTDGRGGAVTETLSVSVADPAQSFTQRTSGASKNFNAMASNDSVVVAVGDKGQVYTSSDGVTWSNRSLSSSNLYLYGIVWDGTRFVMVGMDYDFTLSNWVGVIYSSSDAVTWTKRYTATVGGTALKAVASGGGVIVAGGNGGLVIRSSDSVNWTQVTGISGLTSAYSVGGLAYGSGVFLLTSYKGGSGNALIYSSPDAVIWTNRTSGTGIDDSWQDLRVTAFLNDRFVSSGWFSKLRVSTDNGLSFFTTRTTYEQVASLTYGNGVYFGVGENRLDTGTTVADKVHVISADGVSWAHVAAPSFLSGGNATAFFKNTILVAGDSGVIGQSEPLPLLNEVPQVVLSPSSVSTNLGEAATFSVVARGSGALSYQWRKNGTAISGATLASYRIASVSIDDVARYDVVVSNSFGSAESSAATLSGPSIQTPLAVSILQQPADITIVRGASMQMSVTLNPSSAGVAQTSYVVVDAVSGAIVPGAGGSVPANGAVSVSLGGLKFSGSYFLRFTRSLPGGESVTADSSAFQVLVKGWEEAAGLYEGVLADVNGALADGANYRGFLSVSVTRLGYVSGKLSYNEAPVLAGSGTLGARAYTCVTRSFVAPLQVVAGTPLKFSVTPKIGSGGDAGAQVLSIVLDLSGTQAELAASVVDNVSLGGSGQVLSVVEHCVRMSSSMGAVEYDGHRRDLRSAVGTYTIVSDKAAPVDGVDNNLYVLVQVMPSSRVLWSSRLTGVVGTGSTALRAASGVALSAPFYEGRTRMLGSLFTSASLLGTLGIAKNSDEEWRVSLSAGDVAGSLERQVTRTATQRINGVSTPVYVKPQFDAEVYGSGVSQIGFSDGLASNWSSVRLFELFPPQRSLRLVVEPVAANLSAGQLEWGLSFSNSRGFSAKSVAGSDGRMAPALSLKLDRATGQVLGSYTLNGAVRTLFGVIVRSETNGALRARGWVESGNAGVIQKPTFDLWRLELAP
ncbi:MAG: PKD domain-containing protein [Verrucomicrobiota bacterium]